jgi:hypothetical protein
MNPLTPYPKTQVCFQFKDLEADRAVVERILLTAAAKFDLYDNSNESTVPHTIRSIVEAKGFGFGLGARVVGDRIHVDFKRHRSQSPKFDETHDFILKELKAAFHLELEEVCEDNPAYCKTNRQ